MKRLFTILCCIWTTAVYSQKPSMDSGITEYLNTAHKDQKLERFQAELNFLESNSMKPSIIRETEVRFGSEGLNTSLEDYQLRVSPTNPWEIKSNKAYRQQLEQNTKTRYRISFSKALKSRYELLIEHLHLTQMVRLTEEEITLRRKLSEQLIGMQTIELSMEDIIELEADLGEAELKLAEIKIKKQRLSDLISLDLAKEINWEGFTAIRPETALNVLFQEDTLSEWNLYKLEAEQKLALEEKMYQVNKTEAFSNIGFLQGNFETDQGDTFREHMGFRVGITLPIFNRDKADLARDRFELIEAKTDEELTEQMIDERMKMLRSGLQSSHDMYLLISRKLERLERLKPTLNNEIDLQAFFRYINYRSSLLKKKEETHYDLLNDYIELLDIKGLLVRTPLINYLSDSLTYLEK